MLQLNTQAGPSFLREQSPDGLGLGGGGGGAGGTAPPAFLGGGGGGGGGCAPAWNWIWSQCFSPDFHLRVGTLRPVHAWEKASFRAEHIGRRQPSRIFWTIHDMACSLAC